MNRLQLVQRLNQEAGATGATISTTLSQSGLVQRLIDWIDSAYQDIQNLRENWDFLREDFSFTTNTTSREYTKDAISLTDLNAWKTDDVRVYKVATDETQLIYEPWDNFKRTFIFGAHRTTTARPFYFSIDAAGSFWTDYIPNDTYTINGEYFKVAQAMSSTGATANTDTPLIPTRYQMAIVWRALMFYGAYEGADEVYTHGEKEYRAILSALEFNQLPRQRFLRGPLV